MLNLLIHWAFLTGPAVFQPQTPATRELLHAVISRVVQNQRPGSVLLTERAVVTAPLPVRSLPDCDTPEARSHPTLPCGPSVFDSLPAGLLTTLRPADTAAARWTPADVPLNADLLPDSLRATFRAAGPRGYWDAIRARFPTPYLVTVSRFQLAPDGRSAAATVAMRCGSLCGYVVYAVLEVGAEDRRWSVTRWITALRF